MEMSKIPASTAHFISTLPATAVATYYLCHDFFSLVHEQPLLFPGTRRSVWPASFESEEQLNR